MSNSDIYYYGLIFAFLINYLLLYINVYHNDYFKKPDYTKILVTHCFLFLTSWIGIIIIVMVFIKIEIDDYKKDKRKKR